MSSRPEAFLTSLASLLSRIEVTDGSGRAYELDAAFDAAVRFITKASAAGKLVLIGNGGSAAMASHIAVDLWKNAGLRALAFNDASLLTCVSNDFGYEAVFEKPITMFADAADLVIALSSSGRSQNIRRGVAAARERGCRVLTLSGFRADNPLRSLGDLNFWVPSSSYGEVEVTHLAICHGLVDSIIQERGLRIVAPGTS